MTNMSYCRFYNTRIDMSDCIEALRNKDISSEEEKECAKRMFNEIFDYLYEEGILDWNSDENPEEKINDLIDSCGEKEED